MSEEGCRSWGGGGCYEVRTEDKKREKQDAKTWTRRESGSRRKRLSCSFYCPLTLAANPLLASSTRC